MNREPIIFVTSHAEKARHMTKSLGFPVVHRQLELAEIQSLDPNEVAAQKVREAYRLVQKPVVVEDVSVRFRALGRLPGPLFKAFLSELGIEGMCKLLDNYNTRDAAVEVDYAYFDGQTLKVFSASREGRIAKLPRGKAIFGSDAIFIPRGYTKTWTEMDEQGLAESSVTTKALCELRMFLELREAA